MRVDVLPTLVTMRDLYAMPRGEARFRTYVQTMTGGGDDVVLPIVAMNPMGKEHCLVAVERLLAMDAEGVVRAAAAEAAGRLRSVDLDLRIGLVLCDEVGGWTDRDHTEAEMRLRPAAGLKRGLASVPTWAAAGSTASGLREETLSTVYRFAHAAKHGPPRTLGEAVLQEGRAARFAGAAPPGDVAVVAAALAARRADADWATVFAGMYGDEAARRLGHAPLGVPPRGGFAVGLAEAFAEGSPPERSV